MFIVNRGRGPRIVGCHYLMAVVSHNKLILLQIFYAVHNLHKWLYMLWFSKLLATLIMKLSDLGLIMDMNHTENRANVIIGHSRMIFI